MRRNMKKELFFVAACASILATTGCLSVHSKLMREVAGAGLPERPNQLTVISDADLAPHPEPVQRYLRFMGVVGRPRNWSFRIAWNGRFRTKPDQDWMDIEAHQYNTRLDLARFFYMSLRMKGISVMGRDTLFKGKGRMLIKPLDLFTVADGQGAEYDIGELVTYLNDGIFFAPSMLLGPETRWEPVDENSFDVSLTDRGISVKARVYLDEKGAPKDFSTTDRFYSDPDDPKHLVRAQWNTPVSGWTVIEGRAIPMAGQAIWQLPGGPFTYAEFRPDPKSFVCDVAPGK